MTTPRRSDAAGRLRAAGLTPTGQRHAVLDALAGRRHPTSAQDIHAELRAAGLRIGVTTVYRVLTALTRAELVHTFVNSDGERTYRHCAVTPHLHLICARCGIVHEHDAAPSRPLLSTVLREHDFAPDPRRTDVHGLCGTCRRAD